MFNIIFNKSIMKHNIILLNTQRNSFSIRRNNYKELRLRRSSSSLYGNVLSNSTFMLGSRNKVSSKMVAENYMTYRAQSSTFRSLTSTCWCLFDESKNVELGFRHSQKRQIASLTKIMSTIIGLQIIEKYNISPSVLIRVTESACKNIGTSAKFKINSWIFLKDIFYGVMLPSGNDAAHLLSEFMGFILLQSKKTDTFSAERLNYVDLSKHSTSLYIAQFVKEMNLKAEQLRMNTTRFSNPHGLQNAMNISTAKDILTLSIYCSKNKIFRKIMNTESHRCYQYMSDEVNTYKELSIWKNTNVLLKEGWEGIKTGQTVAAGSCLASLKKGVYIVVLNCPNPEKRFTETKRLYEWYSNKQHEFKSTFSTSCLFLQF